jgi:Uma2 family endonuclease
MPFSSVHARAAPHVRRSARGASAGLVPYWETMTSPAHRVRYSWADYVALEASSNVKHEFLDGQIYAMAGGTPEHAALAAAVIGLLFGQLRGGRCRAYDADLRVRVLATGLATYPDVTIVCGPPERAPDDENAVTNPSLVVEVLSPSTEEYDREEKFEHYKQIPSLRQYVLVSYREREVEVWTRDDAGGWSRAIARDGESARLDVVGAALDVRELYDAAAEPRA